MRRYAVAVLTLLLAVVNWLPATHGQSPELSEVSRRVVDLYSQGRYAEAAPLGEKAVRLSEQEFGPDHPSTAITLDNLAQLYYAQGRYSEAEPLYQRALADPRRRRSEPSTRTLPTSLDNLAGRSWHLSSALPSALPWGTLTRQPPSFREVHQKPFANRAAGRCKGFYNAIRRGAR